MEGKRCNSNLCNNYLLINYSIHVWLKSVRSLTQIKIKSQINHKCKLISCTFQVILSRFVKGIIGKNKIIGKWILKKHIKAYLISNIICLGFYISVICLLIIQTWRTIFFYCHDILFIYLCGWVILYGNINLYPQS